MKYLYGFSSEVLNFIKVKLFFILLFIYYYFFIIYLFFLPSVELHNYFIKVICRKSIWHFRCLELLINFNICIIG